MNATLRKNRRRLMVALATGCSLGLTCILIALVSVVHVRADMGVQPILPGGSSIKPEEETPIRMVAEKVVMTVRRAMEADSAAVKFNPEAYGLNNPDAPIGNFSVAEVTADFTMANPTNEALSMIVWFPLASALENAPWEEHTADEVVPRIERFQVAVDGKAVDYNVSELPNPRGADKPPLPWASFPITFPARQEVPVQVNYLLWVNPSWNFVSMTLYYVFQTGAGWAGPIGKAELVVNLPYPASTETIGAMPEGGQIEGQQVRWTWENLEPGPQDDFAIMLMGQSRWEELKAAKNAVKDHPEDGEAWLDLCSTYHLLIFGAVPGRQIGPGFSENLYPMGVQACQEAARLLPGNANPHYELAMLYLSALPQNPSPEALQPVWDQTRIMAEIDPALAQALLPNVQDLFELLINNDPSAPWLTWNDYWATQTAIPKASLTPPPSATITPTQKPTLAPTTVPTLTSVPLLSLTAPVTVTPTAIPQGSHTGIGLGIVVVSGLLIVLVVFLVLKRRA